ncbi:MAG: TIGR03619 family F420-dependent LLM class oxidoreductase [Dehalococcoidia bacterium]|nr:TIGR03619 family F420-dependent LLM class oxidoreductase [Dehalococcoidia bacterium]
MQAGVNILNFGPGADPAALLGWAQTAEALGYHSVLISDHVAITPSVRPRYPEPYYDTFTTLAWLAGQTQRVRLGTTVCVLPYRHPVLTARLAANVDQLSGGRFIFGVGVGNAQDEYAVLGQPHNRRGVLANECLRAILALWTAEGSVSFHGRLVNFDDVSAIQPAQRPHPPIWVGGASDAALRRTARLGDAWHPILRSLQPVEAALASIRAQSAALGRPAPRFSPRIRLDIREEAQPGDRLPGAGALAQVRDDLLVLDRLGADHVTLDWFTGDLEATRDHAHGHQMLRLLAEQVLNLPNQSFR